MAPVHSGRPYCKRRLFSYFDGEDFAGNGPVGRGDAVNNFDAQSGEVLAGLEIFRRLPLGAVVLDGHKVVRVKLGTPCGILDGEIERSRTIANRGGDRALDGCIDVRARRRPAWRSVARRRIQRRGRRFWRRRSVWRWIELQRKQASGTLRYEGD